MPPLLRWLVTALGIVICISPLFFWLYVNGLASAFANKPMSVTWTDDEAFQYFWLPFTTGAALILLAIFRR